MKITLHLAISADGFIAKPNGDSDWVSPQDETLFKNRAKEAECIVIGRRTFEQYQNIIYPIKEITNIVLTRHPLPETKGIVFADSPMTAVKLAKEKGHTHILIAGGGHTSASFLEAGLIDEIFFSVHPLILGEGIKPFGEQYFEQKVQLISSQNLGDGLLELHYKFLNNRINK